MEIGLLHQLSEFIGTNFRGKGGIFNNYSGRGGHRGGRQGYPNPGYQNLDFNLQALRPRRTPLYVLWQDNPFCLLLMASIRPRLPASISKYHLTLTCQYIGS